MSEYSLHRGLPIADVGSRHGGGGLKPPGFLFRTAQDSTVSRRQRISVLRGVNSVLSTSAHSGEAGRAFPCILPRGSDHKLGWEGKYGLRVEAKSADPDPRWQSWDVVKRQGWGGVRLERYIHCCRAQQVGSGTRCTSLQILVSVSKKSHHLAREVQADPRREAIPS
jgi:hypothetical protein